jgi:membrane-bound lytic murein transglycosylase B
MGISVMPNALRNGFGNAAAVLAAWGLLLLLAATPGHAADTAFQQYLQSLWPQAQQAGVSRATFDAAIRGHEPDL